MKIYFLKVSITLCALMSFSLTSFAEGHGENVNKSGVVSLNNQQNKVEDNNSSGRVENDFFAQKKKLVKTIRKNIIDEKIDSVMPITPKQIMDYRKRIDIGRQAASAPIRGKVKLLNETIPLVIGESEKKHTIYLSTGFVTSLSFLDVKGNPWPVKVAVKGDGDKIATTRVDKHLVFMSTNANYSDTNMAFVLEGINSPINFRVVTNMNTAHEKVQIIIQDLGPEAKKEHVKMEGSLETVNQEMYSFLDNLPPSKASAIEVSGFHANAWVYKGKIYIRTSQADLISPAYAPGGLIEGGDGAKVYRMEYSPIVMFVYKGKVFNATLKVPSELYNKEIINNKGVK